VKGKIALYSLGIGIIALGGLIYNHLVHGEPILLDHLPLILVLAPVFGFFLWLRWDWAKEERQRKLGHRDLDGDA